MSENVTPIKDPVAIGEYEVLIQSITPKVTASGMAYNSCRLLIQDEGPYKDRLLFFCQTRFVPGLPTSHQEIHNWQPRYGIVKVKHKSVRNVIYPHPDALVVI